MKISEYVRRLEAIITEHGDLEVEIDSPFIGRIEASAPTIAYRGVLRGRQNKPRFWDKFHDDDQYRGERVVRI